MQALQDLFDLFANPRYVLAGGGKVFAVPRVFGDNQERARRFHRLWCRRVGRVRLVYAYSDEGRRLLIQTIGRLLADPRSEGTLRKTFWG